MQPSDSATEWLTLCEKLNLAVEQAVSELSYSSREWDRAWARVRSGDFDAQSPTWHGLRTFYLHSMRGEPERVKHWLEPLSLATSSLEVESASPCQRDLDMAILLVNGLVYARAKGLPRALQRGYLYLLLRLLAPYSPMQQEAAKMQYARIVRFVNLLVRLAIRRALRSITMIECSPQLVAVKKIPSPKATDEDHLAALAA